MCPVLWIFIHMLNPGLADQSHVFSAKGLQTPYPTFGNLTMCTVSESKLTHCHLISCCLQPFVGEMASYPWFSSDWVFLCIWRYGHLHLTWNHLHRWYDGYPDQFIKRTKEEKRLRPGLESTDIDFLQAGALSDPVGLHCPQGYLICRLFKSKLSQLALRYLYMVLWVYCGLSNLAVCACGSS